VAIWNEGEIKIANANAENLTIKPHPDNTYPIRIQPTGTACPFRSTGAEDVAGTYTFENLGFSGLTTTATYIILYQSNKSLSFVDCTFTAGDTTLFGVYTPYAGTNTDAKTVTYSGCTFTSFDGTQSSAIYSLHGKLIVDDCTFDWDEGDSSGGVVQGGYNTLFEVTNCNFSAGMDAICTSVADTPLSVPAYSRITGNVMIQLAAASVGGDGIIDGVMGNYSHSGTATGGGNDYILLACEATLADDYWNSAYIKILSGTGIGQVAKVVDYDATGHVSGEKYAQVDAVWATNPDATSVYLVYFEPKTKSIIENNVYINNGTSSGYGITAAMGVKDGRITGNYVYMPNAETALLVRGENAVVKNNVAIGLNGFRWQGTGHCEASNNTFLSVGNNSSALAWRINGVSASNPPLGTMNVYDNILYATGTGSYCLNDLADTQNQFRFDHNNYYYANGAKAGYLNATAYDTLTLMLAKWASPGVWGTETLVWTDNDTNSVVANPNLDSNYRPRSRTVARMGVGAVAPTAQTLGGSGIFEIAP
jgi:hypothetical protein